MFKLLTPGLVSLFLAEKFTPFVIDLFMSGSAELNPRKTKVQASN